MFVVDELLGSRAGRKVMTEALVAVASRGADHLKGYSFLDKTGRTDVSIALFGDPAAGEPHTPKLKGLSVKFCEELHAMADALGICKVITVRLIAPSDLTNIMTLKSFAPLYTAVTGLEITPDEFAKCCERIVVLEKCFNARLGITRKDDTLGERWMKEPCPSGPGKGMKCEDYLDNCLDEYYRARGFDVESGTPTREKLEELGLREVADELENLGVIKRKKIG
jgi:aldehyde:ferredoxin oxidoreductase